MTDKHPPTVATSKQEDAAVPFASAITPERMSPDGSVDIDALLEKYPTGNRLASIQIRNAFDHIFRGSAVMRAAAFDALVTLGQVAEPYLLACLHAADQGIVGSALEGLGRIGSDWVLSLAAELFASPDPANRVVALRSVQGFDDERVRPLLTMGLRDRSPLVRRRAMACLSWWQDVEWALADLRMLCTDSDPTVQWAAIETLMDRRPAETRKRLAIIKPTLSPLNQRRADAIVSQGTPTTED